jgi:hypothetical protein
MIRQTLLLLAVFFPLVLSAQPIIDISNPGERPLTQASQLEKPPKIDGNVLQDEVWQSMPVLDQLWQSRPNAGHLASEKTEIRIAYNNQTLFLSAVCYDAAPEKLVVTDARRDASLDNTDAIIFIFDTYNDGQNGFMFGTNSVGAEYDAQVDNEGQGNFSSNRQQGGMIGGFNLNWDASWTVKTEVGDYGWSAEFAIPLRTIRYNPGTDKTWGLNIRRNIRKTNEIAYWSPLPIQFDLKRLSLAGKLDGLNLKNPKNLKLIPYVLGEVAKDFEVENPETQFDADFGADIKYGLSPNLTLDLTYNTDFAQVEVDDQQVNLDRFNLFFPEKRPFFLENAGLFSVGSPGEVDLFFSRRIGIGENGQQVPIVGGARLSGKINKTNVGFLSMFTEAFDNGETNINGNNFTVTRVNHEFGNRSALGAAFINRQGTAGLDEDFNRTFAVDGKYGIGQKARLIGYYARTVTPGIDEGEHSFQLIGKYEWNGLSMDLGYTEVGEGFNPEVGFLGRDAFRKPEFRILQRIRPKNFMGILELRPHISYRSYWNFEGFQVTSFLHIDNHWEWKNGIELHTGFNITSEGVVEDFEIAEGVIVPAGTYDHAESQIVFFTNPSKNVSINIRSVIGGFFGGTRVNNTGTLVLRYGDKFNSQFSLSRNDIKLPNGDFTTNIFRSRISYSFTPFIFVQSLIQYNSVVDQWTANVRFGWLSKANTGLYIVFNEARDDFIGVRNRNLILKYTRLFDLVK